MNIRRLGVCVAMILMTLGCSDDSSGPDGTGVSALDILNAPIGTIELDGQRVTMRGSHFLAREGEPLEVIGALSEQRATVVKLWFVSGATLESDDDPEACFIPDELCVSHATKLDYEIGIEFVVALDIEASNGEIRRVRSELITVQTSLP